MFVHLHICLKADWLQVSFWCILHKVFGKTTYIDILFLFSSIQYGLLVQMPVFGKLAIESESYYVLTNYSSDLT